MLQLLCGPADTEEGQGVETQSRIAETSCPSRSVSELLKRLGRRLAEKWQRSYSQVMGFVCSRMAVAILRASSQCMRGPRTKIQGTAGVHYGLVWRMVLRWVLLGCSNKEFVTLSVSVRFLSVCSKQQSFLFVLFLFAYELFKNRGSLK